MLDLALKQSLKDSATHYVFGYPFGIEKLSHNDYVIFREFGSRRIYLREEGFNSKVQALAYLEPMVEKYASSIITAIVEEA